MTTNLTITDFRAAADELGQHGANEIFRASLEGRRFSIAAEPVGKPDDDINTVGYAYGWSLLDRAIKPNENSFWASYDDNRLVIVADLNGPMAIWLPVKPAAKGGAA